MVPPSCSKLLATIFSCRRHILLLGAFGLFRNGQPDRSAFHQRVQIPVQRILCRGNFQVFHHFFSGSRLLTENKQTFGIVSGVLQFLFGSFLSFLSRHLPLIIERDGKGASAIRKKRLRQRQFRHGMSNTRDSRIAVFRLLQHLHGCDQDRISCVRLYVPQLIHRQPPVKSAGI